MKSQPKPADDGLPSTEQLAMLAATLARNASDKADSLIETAAKDFGTGVRTRSETVPKAFIITEAALALWLAARHKVTREKGEAVMRAAKELAAEAEWATNRFPPEQKFPITRDVFLRAVLPQYKHRTAELARLAKGFIRHYLTRLPGVEPTVDDIAKEFADWKYFNNSDHANFVAARFAQWHREHIEKVRRDAGLKSAEKRKAAKEKKVKKKL